MLLYEEIRDDNVANNGGVFTYVFCPMKNNTKRSLVLGFA